MLYYKSMRLFFLLSFIPIVLFTSGLKSNPGIELQFPASCSINESCWILNSDKTGTIIAIKSLKAMERGVNILASEDGTVASVKNTANFGNTVVIEHSKGWKTIYAHLKNNSVTVKKGDFVRDGTKIAELGNSGAAEFPHLYFALYKDKEFYDPIWHPSVKDRIKIPKIVVANLGISTQSPSLKKIKEDSYNESDLLNDVPTIYLWAYGFKFKPGDFLKFSISNPDNIKVLDKIITVKQDYTENFFSAETIKGQQAWPAGVYRAKIEFIRPSPALGREYTFSFNIKKPEVPVDEKAIEEEEKRKKTIYLNKKRLFMYKRLYDQGKLPDTVPDNVIETLKRLPSNPPEEN